jgi:preprotein translocase subunit SecE
VTLWQALLAGLTLAVAVALVIWRERVTGWARSAAGFAGEVRAEVQKITWPGREELRRATLVILAFVAFVAVLIGLMDIVLQYLVVTLPGRLA